mmetsp:Transcript_147211/g.472838  ORF Transcript_147211/g.472838 Transcript_147211/m.472838 type:complete len:201 (+) Transcript_147211:844-1446(+)
MGGSEFQSYFAAGSANSAVGTELAMQGRRVSKEEAVVDSSDNAKLNSVEALFDCMLVMPPPPVKRSRPSEAKLPPAEPVPPTRIFCQLPPPLPPTPPTVPGMKKLADWRFSAEVGHQSSSNASVPSVLHRGMMPVRASLVFFKLTRYLASLDSGASPIIVMYKDTSIRPEGRFRVSGILCKLRPSVDIRKIKSLKRFLSA